MNQPELQCAKILFTLNLLCITEPPGPPSAPEVSDITKNSCVLTWEAPDSDGGTPITGYYIERCSGTSTRWININPRNPVPDTTYKQTDLIEGTEYQYRVIAENKVGPGKPGPASKPFTAKDPFGIYYKVLV